MLQMWDYVEVGDGSIAGDELYPYRSCDPSFFASYDLVRLGKGSL